MSIFDKAKSQIEASNAKRKVKQKEHGKRLTALAVEYIGGYGDHKKAQGALVIYENAVEFKAPFSVSFELQAEDIADTAIEGRQDVGRRITVTRLLILNVFALALQKKTESKEAFITFVLADGQEIIFYAKNSAPMELKRKLSAALTHVCRGTASNRQVSGTSSVADELAKLADLKARGLLTDQEFEQQKEKLLS